MHGNKSLKRPTMMGILKDAGLSHDEVARRAPAVIANENICRIGSITGDKDQFGRQAEELCGKVEGIVQLAVGRSWEPATALA